MKKIYLLFGAALLTGSMTAAVLDTLQVDGVYYQLNEETQTAAVIRKDSKFIYEQESVVIPVSVSKDNKAYDVTAVEKAAFAKATCKSITFAVGSKVTEIGQQAFQGALELTELALPEGVKHLQLTAIHGVGTNAGMQLHKLTLPSTVDTLDVMSLQVAHLDTLICNAVMPPHCALTTGSALMPCLPFTSNNATVFVPRNTKVIVPTGSEKYYRAEAGWDYFDCFAAGETDTLRVGDLYYTIHNDSTSVIPDLTGNGYGTLASVIIPATISKTTCTINSGKAAVSETKMPVVALSRAAFRNNTTIQSVSFAEPSHIHTLGMQSMQNMEGMTGTLELPEGLKLIDMTAIYSDAKGGKMPIKKLVLPSTLDSLSVMSIVLNELEELEFKGETAPKCQVRVTTTQIQIPWMINPNNQFPTPKNVKITIPEGSFDSYKNQAGIGDYFDYFNREETGIGNVTNGTAAKTGIYNALGTYMGTDENNLPRGLYIINGKKVIK